MEFFVVQKCLIEKLNGCFGVQSRSKRSKFRQKRCGMGVVMVKECVGKEEVTEVADARVEGVNSKVGETSDKDTEVRLKFRRNGPSILAQANSLKETRFVTVEFEVEVTSCRSKLEDFDEIGVGFDGESKITETDDNTATILALMCLQHTLVASKITSDNADAIAFGEHLGSRRNEGYFVGIMLYRLHEAIHLRIRYSQMGSNRAIGSMFPGERDTYVVGHEGLGHMLFRADENVAEEDGFVDRGLLAASFDEGLGHGEEELDVGCREEVTEAGGGRRGAHF